MENQNEITSENITMIDPWIFLLESIQAIAMEDDRMARLNISRAMLDALLELEIKR